MSDTEQLMQLYKQTNELNEELPGDVIKKLTLYGEILRITGKLHGASVSEWKLQEALRKEAYATCFSLDPNGTVKEKEQKAELAVIEFRRKEATAEGAAQKWKNAYNSTNEIINILKIKLKDLKDVNQGGV